MNPGKRHHTPGTAKKNTPDKKHRSLHTNGSQTLSTNPNTPNTPLKKSPSSI
jgi:hypothetical protein